MIDYEGMRNTVAKGLKNYLGCPVVRSNQNADPPQYPYVSYTITTLMGENKGTYGKYEDGYARKPVTSIWSITALSDDNVESITLANKAREWMDYAGTIDLNDNDVIVQSVGGVTNRDNVLTVEYEYKNGFDAVFYLFDTVKVDIANEGEIDNIALSQGKEVEKQDPEAIIKGLQKQIDVMNTAFDNVELAIEEKGVNVPDDLPVSEYYTVIQKITDGITDEEISPTSTNPVMNKAIYAALEKELDIKDFEESSLTNHEIDGMLR